MSNPIEENAVKILIHLFENNPNQDLKFDGEEFIEKLNLAPYDINNAIDFLDEKGLIERLNWLGTSPFNFGAVYLNSRGNYLYHELKNKEGKINNNSNKIISQQPLAAGSPFGFTDLDWEYVQTELSKHSILKVVFGYQFYSEHYESDALKSNVQNQFEKAIDSYNSKSRNNEVRLLFKPLAAGYGEHLFNEIAREIISSDIAVFDTSDLNPNVMLEMGVALTWGKRVLPIKKRNCKSPPSDISGQTYADYDENGIVFISDNHAQQMISMIDRAIHKKIRP